MDYCKIKTDAQPQMMPNPFRVVVSNPDEAIKAQLAEMFGWLPMQYTEQPEYDPDIQYVVSHWEEENGKAVQVWEVKDKPTPEPTLEERVEDLEGGMNNLLGGEA